MAFYGNDKFISKFLIISILAFSLFIIIYPNFQPMGGGPHYDCNRGFEQEAQNISAAISSYFSEPDRTQIPSYNDLVNSGDYPLKNIDLKRRDKLIKESEFSVDILGDTIDGIKIVLSSKAGKCPFDKGKCPRLHKGKFYVLKPWGDTEGMWLSNYEKN